MADILASPIFTGSGWLFTVLGTTFAALTMWQVLRRSSSFRRAIATVARRAANSEFAEASDELMRLVEELNTRAPAKAQLVARRWSATAGRAVAALESISTTDPLSPASQDLDLWTSKVGRSWASAVRERRGATPTATGIGNRAEAMRIALEESVARAVDLAGDATQSNLSAFASSATKAVTHISYVKGRLASSRNGDLHDE